MVLAAIVLGWTSSAHGQAESATTPVPKECEAPGASVIAGAPLPNIVTALKERKKLTILAIGATSSSSHGPVSGGYYAVERVLETTFTGLDVDVVHRGVSGELASNAAERIKTEVALISADLVLWQLGAADAFAQVPAADFYVSASETVKWLKEHKIDVILVDLRYARSMARNPHYQAVRSAIQEIAKEQNVLRIGRYDAEEALEKIRRDQGVLMSEAKVAESGYVCMAEYLARAIAGGLFVREPAKRPVDKSP